MSMDGIARTNTGGTTDAPYSVSLTTRAQVTEPNQVFDQGLTYKVNEWWSTMFDYRYSHFTVDSNAQFRSVNGATIAAGDSQNQWRIALTYAGFQHGVYSDGFIAGARGHPLP